MEVNDWSPVETAIHIVDSFTLQDRRNHHRWTLDLSWLDHFDVVIHHNHRSEPEDAELVFDFTDAEW